MKKNRFNVKPFLIRQKFFILFLLISVISLFPPFIISCTKSSASFDSLVVCESIDQNTFEPLSDTSVLESTTKTIFAAVSYKNVEKKDSYFFNWTNLDTHEQKTTEKYYFSEKMDLKKGYAVSVYNYKNKTGMFEPGNYLVEFYFNDIQKLKKTFVIREPQMKVASIELASAINKDYSPAQKKEKFSQIETVFACVNFNYLIKGNTILAKWYDSANGKSLLDSSYKIGNSAYVSTYIPFGLQNDKGILSPGNYRVEIYINDILSAEKTFEVEQTEIKISHFTRQQKYKLESPSISFAVPDDWKTVKLDLKKGTQIQIVPPSDNMEIGYMMMIRNDAANTPKENYNNISEDIIEPFLKVKKAAVSFDDAAQYTSPDGNNFDIIIKGFTDKENNEWRMPFCFFTKNNDLYIFYGIVNYSMFASESDEIFTTIIDSIQF